VITKSFSTEYCKVLELINYVFFILIIFVSRTLPITIYEQNVIQPISANVEVHIDAIAKLVRVIDGDTVNAVVLNISAKFVNHVRVGEQISIRFADIDAPELYINGERNEPGWRSRSMLIELLRNRDTLYLDIDDEEIFDHYGRLIAVVYIKVNETHLLNVNKWMVDNGYARIWDFPNSTYPNRWVLYVNISNVQLLTSIENNPTSKGLLRNQYLTPLVLYSVILISIIAGYITFSKYLSKTHSNSTF